MSRSWERVRQVANTGAAWPWARVHAVWGWLARTLWTGREIPGGDYTPALRPVAGTALMWLMLVAVVASWLYRYVHGQPFDVLPWPIPSPKIIDAGNALKVSAGVLAVFGAVLTGVYAHRKQLLAEAESRRADGETRQTVEAEFSRRYSDAVTLLGSERTAIRLGGAYALARLADDWAEQRQTCIDVLCAYLRMPYIPHDERGDLESARQAALAEEDQVHDTIQRLLQIHLHPSPGVSWSARTIDLTGAYLKDADFSEAVFATTATFTNARFAGHARFERASFAGHARFAGASFGDVAGFGDASFASDADFEGASFEADARFWDASFRQGGVFHEARFARGAQFAGARFDADTLFRGASFGADAIFSNASFDQSAVFHMAAFSQFAGFAQASFARADFRGASFKGGASFSRTSFTGEAGFERTSFAAGVGFDAASFAQEPMVSGMTVAQRPELDGVPITSWPETHPAPPTPAPPTGPP